ncbi:MAG: type II toxin-antitoxin system VapC family toxin [Armatimonadetes bacterium]|nr:type II toxin-antitoxin system VapC family toxin [Armatimonadota bacterium]
MVLDASALLAILTGEIRAQRWGGQIGDIRESVVSAVNLSEVVAKLAEGGMRESDIRATVGPLGIDVIPFDAHLAFEAGLLRPLTKSLGLSFGDRACLALALHLRRPALTADRAWAKVQIGVEIMVMA